jgi:hypothetical protein
VSVQPPVGRFRTLPVSADQPGNPPGPLVGGVADQQPQPCLDLLGEPDRDQLLPREIFELREELRVDTDGSVHSRHVMALA